MADVIHVERGFAPWAPGPDAELVKEYRYYDMPLLGVIEQHGVRYLFHCLNGAGENVSVWAYSHLSPDEEQRLDTASADKFDQVVDIPGPVVLAFAIEGLGLVVWRVIDDLNQHSLGEAFHELAREFEDLAAEAAGVVPAS